MNETVTDALHAQLRPMTEEEKIRQLEAIEAAQTFREEMLVRRGGRLVPESWPLIRESREEWSNGQ